MAQLSTNQLNELAAFALSLAEEGAKVLLHFWGNLKNVSDKEGAGNLVTEADKESERRILDLIQKHYPHHAVLAEETGAHKVQEADFLWVIDPLDGTTNYAHQYPVAAVSVGLVYRGQPVVGVIYNPMLKELFQGQRGKGATLNGQKIHVSTTKTIQKSLLASGFAYDRCETRDNNYAEFCHLTNLSQGVRRAGSASLDMAYVAAGRFDGYWERGIKPWDIAAGTVIVEEAGGKVSAYDGTHLDLYSGRVLATNGQIHHQLSNELLRVKNELFPKI